MEERQIRHRIWLNKLKLECDTSVYRKFLEKTIREDEKLLDKLKKK
jgi:hypothetical protein